MGTVATEALGRLLRLTPVGVGDDEATVAVVGGVVVGDVTVAVAAAPERRPVTKTSGSRDATTT